MTLYHLYGDDAGETHLMPIELTLIDAAASGEGEGSANRVRSGPRFSAFDAGYAEIVDPLQDSGLHEAPRRALIVVLRGGYYIKTTAGDEVTLQGGDCMFADDVGTKGHWSWEVGDEPMIMMSIGVPDEFELPGA